MAPITSGFAPRPRPAAGEQGHRRQGPRPEAPSAKADRARGEGPTTLEDRVITLPDGATETISLFVQGGSLGIATLTDTGERVFTEAPPDARPAAWLIRPATAGTTPTVSPTTSAAAS